MNGKLSRNSLLRFSRLILVLAITIVAVRWVPQAVMAQAQAQAQAANDDYITVYPGVYTDREKAAVAAFIAENKALEDRGAIDVQALIHGTLPKDTPGLGATMVVTEAMVRYDNQKYDPENPLLNDAAYARKAGYQNILAYPTFATCDDGVMKQWPVKDKLLSSDLNHNVTNYRPVYPGDTLYTVINRRHFLDLTPQEGSIYRTVAIQTDASLYNQRGEKVSDEIFRVTESMRLYKDGKGPKEASFSTVWDAPNWTSRPAHYYTDKDWEFIKGIWAKEKRQGATPLYWEDVKIGDQPTWTVDGPIEQSVTPNKPYGMGTGGSRSMKKEIMDPNTFRTMIRGEQDGIYRLPNRDDYVPPVPDQKPAAATAAAAPAAMTAANGTTTIDTKDIHKQTAESRAALINYMGRDMAIRHIDNWMGDRGWIYNIRWSIMDPRASAAFGKPVLTNPEAEHFLDKVPVLKGKHVSIHPLTEDVGIVKSYVTNKFVRDGDAFVDLVWWVENISGEIWEEGSATVKLPSKNAH
jgi:acyl dehydratase